MPIDVKDMDIAFPDGLSLKAFDDRDDFLEVGLALMKLFDCLLEGWNLCCGVPHSFSLSSGPG